MDSFAKVLLYFIQNGGLPFNGEVKGLIFGAAVLMAVPLVLAVIEGRVEGYFNRQFWVRNSILTLLLGAASAAYASTQRSGNHIIDQLSPGAMEMTELAGVVVLVAIALNRRKLDKSWKGQLSGSGLWSLTQGFYAAFLGLNVVYPGFRWPPLFSTDAMFLRVAMLGFVYLWYQQEKRLVVINPSTNTKRWQMPYVDTMNIGRRRRLIGVVVAVGLTLAIPYVF